ncbi:glutamate 5-kinase [Malassezia brasiliensis]|uniref:Glutamate 5-kinase n=1 Tax=Malassezia brasiliensis TaxID=1821822 RepID=A0AAF0INH9_9BASI|nr:glutamate 5-kinase [Malassezia brasiliensis]
MSEGGKTVVIKLGTSSILSESTMQPKIRIMSSIVETVLHLRTTGHRVILVCSGAIGVGRVRMGMQERPKDLGQRQALAALGQLRLMSLWDNLFGVVGINVAQVLVTRADLADSNRYHNARTTLETLMSSTIDAVPIVNENDTVSVYEMRFGDNDSLSAITAGLVDADFLFLCTDVDGLYTDNPRVCPDARRLDIVRSVDEARRAASVKTLGSSFGTGGMQTKLIAAELATAAGVATVILNGEHPENILRIVQHGLPKSVEDGAQATAAEPAHTMFLPSQSRLPARKWRILHAMHPVGSLIIDQGAYDRISSRDSGGRLLPAGVVGVQGNWERLQAVRLLVRRQTTDTGAPEDVEVGRALANYTSVECERIKGLQSAQIYEVLGCADSQYVTDQIVLTGQV